VTVDITGTVIDEVNRNWAEHDLDALTSDAVKHLTAGTATDWGMAARVESPVDPITLGGGIPDPLTLPREELLVAMERALAVEDDSPLRYGGSPGYEGLRELLAQRYSRDRGLPVTADHFLLTNGGAGAIDHVAAAFLSPGDVVISEAPTFSGTLRTFRGYQAELLSVDMDEQGISTEHLQELIDQVEGRGQRVKMIYTIANFHNPTGISMSLERREELVRIASRHGALVLDDDAYGEFFFGDERPPALSALCGGQGVITIGTFSKIVATGLRVGWIHAEPEILDRITRMRFEMGNSPLLHRMLLEYSQDGQLDKHIEEMRALYLRKLDTLCDALVEHAEPYLTFKRPEGGFFLWVELAEGLDPVEVQATAIEEGVVFPAGYAFFPDRVDTGRHLRLAFTWAQEDELREGAVRLARACERVANGEGVQLHG
jgi:2-aminoadipate transaminase